MRQIGLLAVALVCGACGGGGSGSDAGPSAGNSAPFVSSANPDQIAYTFVGFSYDATQDGTTFSDRDADTLTYSVEFSPDANGLSAAGGIVSGTIEDAIDVTATVTARDPSGTVASNSFRITGAESIASTATCPAANEADAGINTGINLVLDGDIDPALLAGDALAVSCGGVPVAGTTTVVGNSGIQFVASSELPPSASCAVLLTGAIGVDGTPVRPTEWAFATSNQEKSEWRQSQSTTLLGFDRGQTGQPAFDILYSYFENGRHVVLYALDGSIRVAVSEDGGTTYSSSGPLLGPEWSVVSKWNFNFDYHDGQLFIAFRSQGYSDVTGLETMEYIYLQSTTDLLTYSAPIVVTNPHDFLSVFSPGVAADADRIYMSWRAEECFGCPFDTPGQGVYLAEFDRAKGSLESSGMLDPDGKSPIIEAGDDVLLSWYRDIGPPGLPIFVDDLYNHSEGITYSLELAPGGPPGIRTGDLFKIGPSTIQRTWIGSEERGTIKNFNNFVYDTSTHLLSYNYKPATVQLEGGLVCPLRQATDRNGSMVTMGTFGLFSPGMEMPVHFSADSGATYEVLLTEKLWERSWCPAVAVENASTLYIVRADTGEQADPPHTDLVSLKYAKAAPCQL